MKAFDKEGWLTLAISIIVSILFFVTETYAQQKKPSGLKEKDTISLNCVEFSPEK